MLEYVKKQILKILPDKLYLKRVYSKIYGEKLDFHSPNTFDAKLQWLKIYDRNPLYTKMVDKYEVKKYVAAIIGEEYIIPTIGVWNAFAEIDFDKLPKQFVLKCTHDSGGMIICKDRSKLNILETRKKLEKCLKNNFYWQSREWPYKNVKKRIIAEKFMSDNESSSGLTDYKFYCFNGEPKFLYVSQGLEDHATAHISFLNMDWTFAPYERSDFRPLTVLPKKPETFDEMRRIAKILSADIPFVRVDLYQINGRVYFSELTFSPCGGFCPFKERQQDIDIGKYLILPASR